MTTPNALVVPAGASSAAAPERDELTFPAAPKFLADVRRSIERLAEQAHLGRAEVNDLLTAVDEAVANAIRHGSPRGEGDMVAVVAEATPGAITVSIQDNGGGFQVPAAPEMPGPDALGGRGLPLMCALADSVEVSRSGKGTRVVLKKSARAAAATD